MRDCRNFVISLVILLLFGLGFYLWVFGQRLFVELCKWPM
jgi:hypothetical protein